MVKSGQVVFIQITEAHTSSWPLGFDTHPSNHIDFNDRRQRAQKFKNDYASVINNCEVYVDGIDNNFEQMFQTWPDRFYRIDENMKVIEKSQYNEFGILSNDWILSNE